MLSEEYIGIFSKRNLIFHKEMKYLNSMEDKRKGNSEILYEENTEE